MNTRYKVYLLLLAIAIPGALYIRSKCSCPLPAVDDSVPIIRSVPPDDERKQVEPAPEFLGDRVLENYRAENSDGRADLRLLHGFVSNALLLSKQADPRHYATNEDLVQLLLGNNGGNREQLLGTENTALNELGQLVDRWNSPVIVHIPRQGVIELRSAGPDKESYTEDDIQWPVKGNKGLPQAS